MGWVYERNFRLQQGKYNIFYWVRLFFFVLQRANNDQSHNMLRIVFHVNKNSCILNTQDTHFK